MSEPETFVVTREIRAAIEGREGEILDALNIDWRKCSRSNHLRCPYPSHGGDGLNWRWDTKQRKAHCTCQDGHADNALDVLLKVEGLDLEAGKLRAAEILSRPDLVREKGGKGQKTDPASLLAPPAALQAPDLPRSYLAFRLGIGPADVLMPDTRAVGWSGLPYVEATTKGTKTTFNEVAKPPCTVWETVAADGRRHAHRIYTAEAGQGKADLGETPDGRKRDPKKSASAPKDAPSTAGCSVLWGEPSRWKTFAILSSETSLEAKIRADGGAWTGGQAVRIADVDVSNINRLVDSATFDRINGVLRNHGHAGPAFARALVEAGTHARAGEVRDGINIMARRLAGPGADPARIRAALPLAILAMAGGMAQTYGLLPQGEMLRDAIRWAWTGFQESSDAVALDPAEQAISNIRAWVAERWRTSLHNLNAEERPMRDAVGWFDDDAVYLIPERLVEAAGGTLKEGMISRALNAAGMLAKRKSDENLAVFWVPKIGKLKAYALCRSHFGRETEDDGTFKAYAGGRA